MNYNREIIYDDRHQQIKEKFVFLVCGHKLMQTRHQPKIYFDTVQKYYYIYCPCCQQSTWIESFNCLGCFTASLKPLSCRHQDDRQPCSKLTRLGRICQRSSKINNSGFCGLHNNQAKRLKFARVVLNSLPPNCMIQDIINTILKYAQVSS